MTSDNGYFMYYDTSIISEADAEDLATLIKRCNDAGKKFRFALENAWYTASFFFATGCHSNWTMDAEGNFNAVDDDFNSDKGLAAMKGMQMLAQAPCYDSDADIFTDAGVIVTGIWNAGAAADHFGANLGATDLPSFTVDGKSYHLGGFTGNKLMGVKPQTDAKKAAVLSLLAEYLTSEECQLQRFNSFEWGPSNIAAQQSEAVQANVSLAAFAKQAAYGQPQGQIHGSWWDIAKVLGADAKNAKADADLSAALVAYENSIKAVLEMTDEQKQAWSVIGNICNTNWDTDLPMTKVSEGVWESEVLALEAGKEFKVRQGASWDVNFGVGGAPNGANIVVETTGNYKVKLTYDGTTATIELVPAN
jgi:maltose-binding protein MalE